MSRVSIRLAIVNDYEVVVRGLASMLAAVRHDLELVELVADSPVRAPVDVALYDTFGRPQSDVDRLRALSGNPQVSRVAVYTWNFEPSSAATALAMGASGYLAKSLNAPQLVNAVRDIHAGNLVVSPPAPRDRTPLAGDWPGRANGLTPRESEVIALITQGYTNQEIATSTGLSINSVKSYIRSGYGKVGVRNRSAAVRWGIEHGFLPDQTRIRHPVG